MAYNTSSQLVSGSASLTISGGEASLTTNTSITASAAAATATITINSGKPSAGNAVTLVSTDGTSKTYTAVAGSANFASNQFSIDNNHDDVAFSLEQAIEHSSGHNGKILVSRTVNVLALTQATVGSGGNTTITSTLANSDADGKFVGGSTGAVVAAELDISGDVDIDGTTNLDDTDIDGTLVVDGSNISLDSTSTLNIDNSNTSNGITIGTATSGVPISIGHTTSEVTVNDNLTVTGDLTVNGALTTLQSTNTIIKDTLIELANGASTGADSGIIIERGSTGNNAAFIWDESRDEFVLGTTTATGASTGDLTVTRGNLSVERIGAGTEQAQAKVHAINDVAASPSHSTNAVVIIEDDNRPALQFVGSANNAALIQFGDNAAAAAGQLYYDHSTDKLRIDAGGNTDRITVDANGDLTVANDVKLLSDSAAISFGADSDVTLTHVHNTGLLLNSTSVIQFNDASQNIGAPNATTLDINATDEIELNATLIDVNGNLDVSGTYTGGGLMTTGGNIVIPDAGSIGSASDTNAITISSGGVVAITATTANTSASDGALTVAGGAGIAADLTVGDDFRLISDSAVLSFGADSDTTLTHTDGTGLTLNSTNKLCFNDASQFIQGASATVMEIGATDEIGLTATLVDMDANLDLDGTANISGLLTIQTGIVPDAQDGAYLGTSSLQWSDLFLADGAVISFGDDNEITLTHVADTGLTLESAAASTPVFEIKNTHNGGTAGILKFNNTEGGNDGADGDDLGSIQFWGNDDGTPSVQQYAGILAEISDASSGAEGGKLSLQVAEHDGTVTTGLLLQDGSADGEIDVTVGAGAASVVSVPGVLSVANDIILDDGGSIKEAGGTAAITINSDGEITTLKVPAAAVAQASDHILFFDGGATGAPKVESIDDFLSAIAGSGISVSNSQLTASGGGGATAADDIGNGDAAVNILTTSGNITLDAQANDADIIFKVDDGGNAVTALTLDGSDEGNAVFVNDLKLSSDAAVIHFGANNEVTLTHVHDVGLTITNTINGTDNRPVVLQLKSEEDAVVADDVIGSLEFAAGDSDGTDGAAVAAGIHAIAEDTFSASANATKLVFTTGVSETAAASATAKMTLSSAGLLTIADDFMIKDGGTIGVASVNDAITISSGGIVTFKDDIIIKDGGTIGSASDVDAISIASDGKVTFTQDIILKDGVNIGSASDTNAIGISSGGVVSITATTASTAANDGALTVAGGVGIAADLSVGDDIRLTTDSAVISLGAGNDATLTHDGTTGLTIAANPITLDSAADLVLDAGGGDFNFKVGGTEILRITNSSSDVIIKPIVDAKDLIFQQRDGTEVARIEDNGTFNVVTDKLAINGTAITSTAAEINLIDGGTSRGTTAVANGDGFLHNDAGTMRMTNVSKLADLFAGTGIDASSSVLSVAAAQTGITSILATDVKIGEDDETKIDFEDANKINFYANNAKEMVLVENALTPGTSDGTALGTSSLMWSDIFLASGAVANFNNGDMTLTHSSNTLTVAGGTLATAALTTSTITASGIIKTDDSTNATSTTDGSLQTDGGLSVVLDAVFGDDVALLSDSSVLSFGANSEITVTHVHDAGLTITNTINGTDNRPCVLQLKSEEDAIVLDDVIASIEFAAGDSDGTDGATVAAGIHAIAEGTFSASANATSLVFTTGVSETAASSANAKMKLSSGGDLTVFGDTHTLSSSNANDPQLIIKNTTNDASGGAIILDNNRGGNNGANNDVCGKIEFAGQDNAGNPQTYAIVSTAIQTATNGQEGGSFTVEVANHDGGLETGLKIVESSADGVLNVELAAGTASQTHTAGRLGVGNSAPKTALDVVHDYHNVTFENQLASAGDGGGHVIKYNRGNNPTLTLGQLHFLQTTGVWTQTDADAVATGATQLLGIAMGTNPQSNGILLHGFVRIPQAEILNVPTNVDGLPVYVSTTAGHIDFTAPSGAGDFVRIVGHAVDKDSNDVLIWFCPSPNHVEL